MTELLKAMTSFFEALTKLTSELAVDAARRNGSELPLGGTPPAPAAAEPEKPKRQYNKKTEAPAATTAPKAPEAPKAEAADPLAGIGAAPAAPAAPKVEAPADPLADLGAAATGPTEAESYGVLENKARAFATRLQKAKPSGYDQLKAILKDTYKADSLKKLTHPQRLELIATIDAKLVEVDKPLATAAA